MKQHWIALSYGILFTFGGVFGVSLTQAPTTAEKYNLLEFHLESGTSLVNPFTDVEVYADFTSPSGSVYRVGGFYDGDGTWKIRFKPNRTGTWHMTWHFQNEQGSHSFSCAKNSHPNIHGHIHVDPDHPRKLRYEDGTPLFWHGGKYLCIEKPFGTADRQDLSYPERLPTSNYVEYAKQYLRDIAQLGLNGVLFKIQALPLNYDGFSMDLGFLQALDDIAFEAMEQGVNIQMNLFDPWGKRKEDVDWTQPTPDNADWLFLEPWNVYSFQEETQFYLEYIVNRYAAFSNVTWEMFNEAEKLDVSANTPTDVYRDFIRSIDPYDVLIGSSEMYTCWYGQNAAYAHMKFKCWPDDWDFMYWAVNNDRRYKPFYFQHDLPYVWNEIGPWESSDYSEEQRQDWFRAQFWSALTLGSAGISEDHWTDIRTVPDRITDYHEYFIRFVDYLVDVNSLQTNDEWISNISFGSTVRKCQNDWNEMVLYIYSQQNSSQTTFDLFLKAGRYSYQFYNPKTGRWLDEAHIREASTDKYKTFTTPSYDQDIVLYVVGEEFMPPTTPVEWAALSANQRGDKVLLRWQTATESNNLGFEISRRLGNEDFTIIGWTPGAGTTVEAQYYSFSDRPPISGAYTYRIRQVDADGSSQEKLVSVNFLQQTSTMISVFPNPGRGVTTIQFQLPATQQPLMMRIYNSLGEEIRSSDVSGAFSGMHAAVWDGRNASGSPVAAGAYFYSISAMNEPLKILHSGQISRIK
jgi:hypothetical protein